MNETAKALRRLETDYLWRRVREAPKPWLDIGCGSSPLPGAMGWDKAEGDAQTLPGVPNGAYGLVWSSHCLEHLHNPTSAFRRWLEVIQRGGYLWLIVPDFKLYEHEVWPSKWNPDHKHYFTINHLMHMGFGWTSYKVLRLQVVDAGYDYSLPDTVDQTLGEAEACVEMVLQKL